MGPITYRHDKALPRDQVLALYQAVDFYKKQGFSPAGDCVALWIYDGHDHG